MLMLLLVEVGIRERFLSKLDGGHLYAFDQDDEALNNVIEDEGFTLINANFKISQEFTSNVRC